MKKLTMIVIAAMCAVVVTGCGNDSTASSSKSNDAAVNAPKSADAAFDATYLKGVRTVTKVPSLEMEVYRKAARKALAQLEAAGAMETAKAQGISKEDYKKMLVEGLVKELKENMRSIRSLEETQQKVALQSAINSL